MKKFYFTSILAACLFFAACAHETAPVTPTGEEQVPTVEEQAPTVEESAESNPQSHDQNDDAEIVAKKGEAAPDFSLEGLDGKTYTLADFKGKVLMLDFFTTDCIYCTDELPQIERIDKAEEDLVVVHVSVGDPKETLEAYRDKHGISHLILMDKDGSVAMQYAAYGTPVHSFVDKKGIFLGNIAGALDENSWNIARPYVFGEK